MAIIMSVLEDLERVRAEDALLYDGEYGDEGWIKTWAKKTWDKLFGDGWSISPVPPNVLVRDIPKGEGNSKGGIIIPASNREDELTRAIVIAIPPHGMPVVSKGGKLLGTRECFVRPGEVVLYEKFRGVEISQRGQTSVLLDESAIVGTVELDPISIFDELPL